MLEKSSRGLQFAAILATTQREWCFSPLVRMECRVRPLSQGDTKALGELDAILRFMTRLALTDEVYERAALVRASTGLKTPDAIHIATALEHGCAELWTADARLARATVPGLLIRLVA